MIDKQISLKALSCVPCHAVKLSLVKMPRNDYCNTFTDAAITSQHTATIIHTKRTTGFPPLNPGNSDNRVNPRQHLRHPDPSRKTLCNRKHLAGNTGVLYGAIWASGDFFPVAKSVIKRRSPPPPPTSPSVGSPHGSRTSSYAGE